MLCHHNVSTTNKRTKIAKPFKIFWLSFLSTLKWTKTSHNRVCLNMHKKGYKKM